MDALAAPPPFSLFLNGLMHVCRREEEEEEEEEGVITREGLRVMERGRKSLSGG